MHGFRRGRSRETQLTEFTQLLTSMHNGIQTYMIVMDFSKAFDKVAQNKPISSLHGYGIDSTTLEWVRSFLSGRTQSVVVDGAESDTLPVTSGVPQGSVLAPAMFLVYINSLPQVLTPQYVSLLMIPSYIVKSRQRRTFTPSRPTWTL